MKKIYKQPQTEWLDSLENVTDLMKPLLPTNSAPETAPQRGFQGDVQGLKYLI